MILSIVFFSKRLIFLASAGISVRRTGPATRLSFEQGKGKDTTAGWKHSVAQASRPVNLEVARNSGLCKASRLFPSSTYRGARLEVVQPRSLSPHLPPHQVHRQSQQHDDQS